MIDEVDADALRVRFAIEAMKSLIGKVEYVNPSYFIDTDGIASDAWYMADSMIAEYRKRFTAKDEEISGKL